MQAHEIRDYLLAESAAKSKISKLTRMTFSNGETEIVHFYYKDQQLELMQENKWQFSTEIAPTSMIIIDGEMIIALRSHGLPLL